MADNSLRLHGQEAGIRKKAAVQTVRERIWPPRGLYRILPGLRAGQ